MTGKLQAVTGLAFGTFLVFHLLNTYLAAFGASAYDGAQQVLRTAYQFLPVEALILLALGVHLVLGLRAVWRKPRPVSGRGRWHRYAGLFLAVVIVGHLLAVRGSSWFFGVYPEFSGLAFSLEAVPGYFYPYYFLLAVAGFYHGLNGAGIALARLKGKALLPAPVLYGATAFGTLLTVLALAGFRGLWTDIGHPEQSAFAKLALQLVGLREP